MTYDGREPGAGPESVESSPRGQPLGERPTPPPGVRVMRAIRWGMFAALAALALVSMGGYLGTWTDRGHPGGRGEAGYRCPMHPGYLSERRGDCPICGMSLEVVSPREAANGGERAEPIGDLPGLTSIQLTPERLQLIGVRVAIVEKRPIAGRLELPGYVALDETRVRTVEARVSGWVREVFVRGIGERVRPGQELVSLSSPVIQQTEQDFVNELSGRGTGADGAHGADAPHVARARLALYGVPEDEIDRAERERTARGLLTLRSPAAGVVIERRVTPGEMVEPGTPLLTLADLGAVWVLAGLYEMDFDRVRAGDRATFLADALPGRSFPGRIDLVHPTVSSETRTLQVRMALENPDGALRPGMYGRMLLAGRGGPVLVVPREAVVETGERQYVFLARTGGRFEPRIVRTAEADDDRVRVLAGVAEGDTVVASAAFLIDSESRLQAAIAGMRGQQGR